MFTSKQVKLVQLWSSRIFS